MRKDWSMQTVTKSKALGWIYVLCYSTLFGCPRGMGENIHNSWKMKDFGDVIFSFEDS